MYLVLHCYYHHLLFYSEMKEHEADQIVGSVHRLID